MTLILENYNDRNGNDVIAREFKKLDKAVYGRVSNKLFNISNSGLTPKNYKRFKGYAWNIEYGEFIVGDFRILTLHYNEKFVLLHLFKKTSNETPQREKDIGWERVIDYISRQKP